MENPQDLLGNDVASLLTKMLTKFADFLEETVQAIMARIWIVSQQGQVKNCTASNLSL